MFLLQAWLVFRAMKLYLDELQTSQSAEGFLPRSYQLEESHLPGHTRALLNICAMTSRILPP